VEILIVKDCMQADVVFATVPGTRDDVLAIMAEQQINSFPVCKKGTKTLVGIITRTDLLRQPDENQIAMLMVRDPVTVNPRTKVKTAAKILIEQRYRRLPVVDGDELIGLISVPDILGAVLENNEKFKDMDIKDFVKREIISVWEKTPLPLSYMIMDMAGTHALVVINEDGGVSGMISVSDYIRLSEVQIENNVTATFSGTDHKVEWGWTSKDFLVVTKKLLKLPNVPVDQVMTKDVIKVSEIATVPECVAILRKNNIDQAPVLSAMGSLVGMLEDKDLLKLVIED
jgi:CBS domain-containing protein